MIEHAKNLPHLLPFCPIVGTTSSGYYNVGSFLTELLTALTHCEFVLKDSFGAAGKIRNIPPQLFDNGYIFASFDGTSLFTKVLLNRAVNIILDCVFNEISSAHIQRYTNADLKICLYDHVHVKTIP